eukprot:12402511-Karenia_brevis.AAC.1
MGLLQEGILTGRFARTVRDALAPAQSGFVRGCEDPHLLFQELRAQAVGLGLCIWDLMGDFEKAFPKTWRADLAAL